MIITIIGYHAKQKRYDIKWKIRNLKKVCIKNRTCYCFEDIVKLEDFHLDNIVIDKKSNENQKIQSQSVFIGKESLE